MIYVLAALLVFSNCLLLYFMNRHQSFLHDNYKQLLWQNEQLFSWLTSTPPLSLPGPVGKEHSARHRMRSDQEEAEIERLKKMQG